MLTNLELRDDVNLSYPPIASLVQRANYSPPFFVTMSAEIGEGITAQEYIESQLQLQVLWESTSIDCQLTREQDARELMPWDPNHCTHHDEPKRQQIFACLTCKEKNKQMNGICYSCSIQCHSSHELVELFTKRGFSCDCGTDRMESFGGCNLRKNFDKLEKACQDNRYGHNFDGRFCSCDSTYDRQSERGTMFQCVLGDACGEDWFHEECILGIPRESNATEPTSKTYPRGINVYDSLESATSDNVVRPEEDDENDSDEDDTIDGLPNQNEFVGFICWQCVEKHKDVLKKWSGWEGVALEGVERKKDGEKSEVKQNVDEGQKIEESASKETGASQASSENVDSSTNKRSHDDTDSQQSKKVKLDNSQISLFLVDGFQDMLLRSTDPDVLALLDSFPFLKEVEVVYEPPEDDDANSSLLDAGTKALNQLPRQQAIDGMHAYAIVRERVKEFLKPFAEQGKVVTESDVTTFFDQVQQKKKKPDG